MWKSVVKGVAATVSVEQNTHKFDEHRHSNGCGYVWRCVWMCVEMVWKCVDICVDVVWKCVDKCDADAVACGATWRSVENGVEKRMFKCGKSVVCVCGSLHTNLHTNLHTSVEVVHLSLHTHVRSVA